MLNLILSGIVIVAPVVIGVLVIFVPSKAEQPTEHKDWIFALLFVCVVFSAVTAVA